MRAAISCPISRVSMALSMRRRMAKITSSWLRSASTADCMSGYCSFIASGSPSSDTARCTWPRDAAAAGWRSKDFSFDCHEGPSSAAILRRTNGQPIGGASFCNFISSEAYSGGSASGMVARSCATFMIGPFRPPSAAASWIAFWPRSSAKPKSRAPAIFAATPADIAADARIARGAGGEAVAFVIGRRHEKAT